MNRRAFLLGMASVTSSFALSGAARAEQRLAPDVASPPLVPALPGGRALATAPVELAGDWGKMLPGAVTAVVSRMRQACLDGVRLVSDGQPARLRVEQRGGGNPAIWLHSGEPEVGWILVTIGERDWSKLAYQFGHELGHVTANSWAWEARPGGPCQWLEEAMVEAFSLRGLARLADDWSRVPPFSGDSGFGAPLAVYRQNIIEGHGRLAAAQGGTEDAAAWFRRHRASAEAQPGLNEWAKPLSLLVLREYERNPRGMEALGALNRWRGRAGVPAPEYFRAWEASCRELGASSELPLRLRAMLGVG